jgi:hypothetical protein
MLGFISPLSDEVEITPEVFLSTTTGRFFKVFASLHLLNPGGCVL